MTGRFDEGCVSAAAAASGCCANVRASVSVLASTPEESEGGEPGAAPWAIPILVVIAYTGQGSEITILSQYEGRGNARKQGSLNESKVNKRTGMVAGTADVIGSPDLLVASPSAPRPRPGPGEEEA